MSKKHTTCGYCDEEPTNYVTSPHNRSFFMPVCEEHIADGVRHGEHNVDGRYVKVEPIPRAVAYVAGQGLPFLNKDQLESTLYEDYKLKQTAEILKRLSDLEARAEKQSSEEVSKIMGQNLSVPRGLIEGFLAAGWLYYSPTPISNVHPYFYNQENGQSINLSDLRSC